MACGSVNWNWPKNFPSGRQIRKLNQFLLLSVRFGFGFLEIQIRVVVGMFGALFAGEQTFNRQQLHAREFSLLTRNDRPHP